MQTTSHLIERLELMQQRKAMLVQPVSVSAVLDFLRGFRNAYRCCGVRSDVDKAEKQRGWKLSALGPVPQMRKKGMSDEQIMDELIAIEIDALRLTQQEIA